MPVHDWSRVSAGTFHDFHCAWIVEIRNALNAGLLPPGYYAQAEQWTGGVWPDVLTLQSDANNGAPTPGEGGGVAVSVKPPKVQFTASLEVGLYTSKQRRLVVRHSSDDRIVAFAEIVSPGNKSSDAALPRFVEKATAILEEGYHMLVIDLQPPTARDPQGIHSVIWTALGGKPYFPPRDKPLTLAAYAVGLEKTCYVEPIAPGASLPDMPLFLTAESYVDVPLEATYRAAYRGVPEKWRRVLEAFAPWQGGKAN